MRVVGPQPGLAERGFHYVIPELTARVSQIEADLYVAHNLAALPPAARAADRHDARLGFDAEDFHRGEVPDTPEHAFTRWLTAWLEERYMPRCDYLTAAAPGIADEYARVLGVDTPTTILNVFPTSEREGHAPPDELAAEAPEDARSLYWFSQTIGPDRGLEDALEALPRLPDDVHLSLRGGWAPGYEATFRRRAEALGVADRIRHLGLVPPPQIVERTAQHDVGLALEHPVSRNREICVTNKLFTYLLAGIPFTATDTPGQRPIVDDLPRAARSYRPGDVNGFADAVRALLEDDGAGDAAFAAARDRYTWDVEKKRFLNVVNGVLDGIRTYAVGRRTS
jgi:glycosyltransferase involved in cell wall biosynthesis